MGCYKDNAAETYSTLYEGAGSDNKVIRGNAVFLPRVFLGNDSGVVVFR